MRSPYIIFILLLVGFAACEFQPKKRQPAILQGRSVDVSLLKREQYDLVERLYAEMADTAVDLKALEALLKNLRKGATDSLKAFESFENENGLYYNAVINKLQAIQDPALRTSIRKVMDSSLAAYKEQTAGWKKINEDIARKQALIRDLHTILKLTRTAAFMRQYQQQYLPDSSRGQAINDRLDSAILQLDSMIRQ